jgi:Pathogenicity locus
VWAFIQSAEALVPRVSKPQAKSPLEVIPGVGPSIARDLESLGIRRVAQLKGADPQKLYDRLCVKTGAKQDRCVLYTFRCAVYYASHPRHEPGKLKWWNWKD